MTLLQQRKLFLFRINMHLPRNSRHFEFKSYVHYYKYETFLVSNKTCVNIFIGLLQEFFCRCLKKFSIKSLPSWN